MKTLSSTSPREPVRGFGGVREAGRAWAELAGLWSLAVAWPCYQVIASGPEALTGLGARRFDLLLLVIVWSLTVPAALLLVEVVVGRLVSIRARLAVHAALLGIMAGLLAWQVLARDGSGPMAILALLGVAVFCASAYLRHRAVRAFAGALAFATPVVIVAFALSDPIRDEVLPHDGPPQSVTLEGDTPVVMIVFDELPVAALEDRRGELDARLFPHLGRLRQTSSWYKRAFSVADQTTWAMPSILTGRDPYGGPADEVPPPGLSAYPENVCTLAAAGGYEVHAYEPITDMCDRTYGLGTRVATLIRRGTGSSGEPAEADTVLAPGGVIQGLANGIGELFPQPYKEYGTGRDDAVDDFIADMPREPRSLSVLHIELPHIQWEYLPDGRTYPNLRDPYDLMLTSPPSRAEVDRDLQQMLLQMQFADLEVGRIVRRLKEDGLFDRSLFIVTADHGASFIPGRSRRILIDANSGWIVPIPLLIKYPGERRARTYLGAVDSRDIAPTILDVLGLDPPVEATGESLRARAPELGNDPVVSHGVLIGSREFDREALEARFTRARAYRNALLRTGTLYALGGHEELLGRVPSATGLARVRAMPTDPQAALDVDTGSDSVPAYFEATLHPAGGSPHRVAIAVNGRIAATATTWRSASKTHVGVNLPPEAFRDGRNEITVYAIPPA